MRAIRQFFWVPLIILFWGEPVFSSVPAGTTRDNLLSAYKGEMTAVEKYAGFAEQAQKEGFPQIAVLFKALSRAEAIHASNHRTVLTKMGVAISPYAPQYTVKTTKENLESAIKGETEETEKTYPAYISTAKKESETSAVKSMRWAMETEAKHIIFLRNALAGLNNRTLTTLPGVYWVCPKCGNTYGVTRPEDMCSFCGTPNSRFIKFIAGGK